MTSAPEWNAIADACEAAEGPDRYYNNLIADAIFGAANRTRNSPFYSSSLDATSDVLKWKFPHHAVDADLASFMSDGKCRARICEPHGYTFRPIAVGEAATPALALCAAFCRAMAVKAENEEKDAAE